MAGLLPPIFQSKVSTWPGPALFCFHHHLIFLIVEFEYQKTITYRNNIIAPLYFLSSAEGSCQKLRIQPRHPKNYQREKTFTAPYFKQDFPSKLPSSYQTPITEWSLLSHIIRHDLRGPKSRHRCPYLQGWHRRRINLPSIRHQIRKELLGILGLLGKPRATVEYLLTIKYIVAIGRKVRGLRS